MRWVKRTLLVLLLLAIVAGVGFFLRPMSYFNGLMYLGEYLNGIESRSVQVEGYRLHYLVEGPANGPVVLLVHGLGSRAEDWRTLAPYLAQAGFRVYIPDLLGYGRSPKPPDFSYSVHDEATLVVAFMDALGLKQVNLEGWSMGGWIAELVAAQHPERVSRLVLFDAAGLNYTPAWNTGLFTPTTPQELAELDALLMPNPPPVPAFIARDVLRIERQNGWVVQHALAQMRIGQDATDALLPQLKMPVLIVWGSLDQITPLALAQTMHRLIPQSKLDVIPGCGHLAPLQCAGSMAPQVVAFARQ